VSTDFSMIDIIECISWTGEAWNGIYTTRYCWL